VRPSSEELVARIVGQSRDVPCELEVVDGAAASCAELAVAQRVEAVLRVREPEAGGAYEVVVCDAMASSEQTRAVPTEHASGDALGASAAYEAVALVVRSALVDIAAEHDARRAAQRALEAERARELAARDAVARQAEARARTAADAEAEAEEEEEEESAGGAAVFADPAWLFFAGAELAAIGADDPAFDLTARLLFALGPMHVGAGFSYGLPAKLALQGTELEIARHTIALIASLPWRASARATLDAGVHAGVSALLRDTRSSRGATPAGNTTAWSALLGVEVGAGLRLAGPFGARLHLALDVLPGAPSYAVEDIAPGGAPAGQTEIGSIAYVQPRVGITLFAAF
jgi:hypothetical protein